MSKIPRKHRDRDTAKDNFTVTEGGAFKKGSRLDLTAKEAQNTDKPIDLKQEVFKLQWPVRTTSFRPTIMVYNESRSWQGHLPITPELAELFDGGKKLKVYVVGIPNEHGMIRVISGISDQPW